MDGAEGGGGESGEAHGVRHDGGGYAFAADRAGADEVVGVGSLAKKSKQTLTAEAGLRDSSKGATLRGYRGAARHPADLHEDYHVGRAGARLASLTD